eukprot:gnl/TRDRNA2_/TRDRNA2_80211_c0_seq1.p1 gnl/TRDRNA2_/TRDRNA2_80211_c0~~gnl/TRDRNA2_/TRDRNA2_80211_c0_seq1.p1  ORF type:complete len:179 (+),score=26.30 gnl/TRDRNA2_/TRDRNA2_80211_c0_seq1:58-594(+)
MMRSRTALVVLFSCMVHTCAYAQELVTKPVTGAQEKLVDRLNKAPHLRRAILDGTVMSKAPPLMIPRSSCEGCNVGAAARRNLQSDDDEEQHQTEFESADAGGSMTFPMEAGQIRKGAFVLLKGFPCKVSETSTSKTGKHGHAKVNFVGYDIFTQRKVEDMCPSSHNMDIPNVKRNSY